MTETGKLIHDYRGGALRLEATRLIEDHKAWWLTNWTASYGAIRKAYEAKDNTIRIRATDGTGKKTKLTILTDFYRPGEYYVPKGDGPLGVIGCRKFTTRTFNIIMKAAGVKVSKASPAKRAMTKYNRALAAKAGR